MLAPGFMNSVYRRASISIWLLCRYHVKLFSFVLAGAEKTSSRAVITLLTEYFISKNLAL